MFMILLRKTSYIRFWHDCCIVYEQIVLGCEGRVYTVKLGATKLVYILPSFLNVFNNRFKNKFTVYII